MKADELVKKKLDESDPAVRNEIGEMIKLKRHAQYINLLRSDFRRKYPAHAKRFPKTDDITNASVEEARRVRTSLLPSA